MKKLLLILFLIPNLIMAEESKWKRKPTFNVEAAIKILKLAVTLEDCQSV